MSFRLPWARIGLGALFAFATTVTVEARVIDIRVNEAKGVDASVDYAKLTSIGPWDDRNYQLTAEDLGYLSKEEYLATDPIPAFFRVWMRKGEIANGHPLPTEGMAQYPRSAVNIFLQRFDGYQIDGHTYKGIRRLDGSRFEVVEEDEAEEAADSWPRFVTGEVKITSPKGAEETAISINPVDTNYVIAGSNGPGSGQKMWRSTDGGVTWSGAISLPGTTCCDAAVGWSTDGAIAYTSTLINCGSSCGVAFYRSTDKGLTWTQSPLLATTGSDKEYLHVDSFPTSPYKDRIYVSWHTGNVQKFAYSTDKGATFSATQTLDSGFKGIGSDISSDKLGNVYYVFPSTGGKQIRVVKSTDGGATFPAVGTKVSDTQTSFEYAIPAMPTRKAFIYATTDADLSNGPYANSIYVAWNDTYAPAVATAASNHARVQVAYSRDAGATWTVTTPHPTSDQSTVDRFQQWMKVDAAGRVHVVWQDTTNVAARNGVDIYYSYSNDGAQTWTTPRRLTTVSSPNIVTSMEWGDYNGMDMAMNDIIAIFTGNRTPAGGGALSDDVWSVGGFADPMGPEYSMQLGSTSPAVCAGSALPQIPVAMTSLAGYTRPVTLSLPGLNASVFTAGTFMPNPIIPTSPSASSVLTMGTQAGAAAGTYSVLVRGTDNQSTPLVHEATLTVKVASGTTVVPALALPADGASGTARQPVFTWAADAAATGYTIEIANDAAFTSIVETGTPPAATYTVTTVLQPMTTYYWRVRANSPCGNSAVSAARSFTTGVTFPEPYCAAAFSNAVEPITRVIIGGINNTSSATLNGSPAHEDFTGIIGTLTAGANASVAVEGNTDGNFKTYISVYIDWNRNGTFDAGENYDIGVISNSTGTDGQQATGTIAVPAGALTGNTRMRVIKKFSSTVAYPAACNTAGFGQAEDYTVTVAAGGPTYTVGGNVSGLSGTGLVLKLNGSTSLPVSANGAFTFAGGLPSGTAYAVTVGTQPSGPVQSCTVANGSGTIGSANVTDVAVTCTTLPTYTVGGTVSGLTGTGLALKLNGGSNLAVSADGAFTFPGGLTSGTAYAVTVGTQPSGQACTLANGSGTMGSANVTNVAVTCAVVTTYTVGGNVSGLSGSGLKLQLNGANDLAIAADGAFTFANALPSGSSYAVTVGTQPSGQTCTVANGSGTIGSANVTTVAVTCSANTQTYTVGGRVSGLLGNGLVLKLNGATPLTMGANGLFVFTDGLPTGASYAVTVGTQPAPQTCTVTSGSGTIASANVTDVKVVCANDVLDRIFADGFESSAAPGVDLIEGFNDITTLSGAGWIQQNNSTSGGTTSWFQGSDTVFPAYDGDATAYIGANFRNTGTTGTISNWLVTPMLTFDASSSIAFHTRTKIATDGVSVYPDRVEVRVCTGAACNDVGSTPTAVGQFTTLLRSVNPNLGIADDPTGVNGYPLSDWAPFTIDASVGLPTSGQGRIAFRYYVTNAGTNGSNSNFIGIDNVQIHAAAIGGAMGQAPAGSITPASNTANRAR